MDFTEGETNLIRSYKHLMVEHPNNQVYIRNIQLKDRDRFYIVILTHNNTKFKVVSHQLSTRVVNNLINKKAITFCTTAGNKSTDLFKPLKGGELPIGGIFDPKLIQSI